MSNLILLFSQKWYYCWCLCRKDSEENAKTTRSLPFFLRVAATGTTARNTSLLIDSVCNGDAKAHRNGARLPSLTWIATQLSFSQEILCTLADTVVYWKWGLLRNQSKRRWCYYSTALTLPDSIFQINKNYIIKQLQPENVKSAQFFLLLIQRTKTSLELNNSKMTFHEYCQLTVLDLGVLVEIFEKATKNLRAALWGPAVPWV